MSYLAVVENDLLIPAPWDLTVIVPLNGLLWAAAGMCQVQDDLPLLGHEWFWALRGLPESLP